MRNRGRCLKCNEIIESKYRHDFVSCSCGTCSVDGGNDYHKFSGRFDSFVYLDDDDNETPIELPENFYPKNEGDK